MERIDGKKWKEQKEAVSSCLQACVNSMSVMDSRIGKG